jgi:hypothetical protein
VEPIEASVEVMTEGTKHKDNDTRRLAFGPTTQNVLQLKQVQVEAFFSSSRILYAIGKNSSSSAQMSAVHGCRQLHGAGLAELAVISITKCHIQPVLLQYYPGDDPTGYRQCLPWSLLRSGRVCNGN